ncbi:ras guanine nucleotide exchange factor domain-containing protein [Halteromyces radiatus]|uniref:ras guanine nucleotide exchange factor domain-containing protein n=1 Tax=Halteromyces radiatus TaxID=101107 RepID=UPI00221E4E22|nr:ras guanine nucleotide exchange factor domain-containing protein [Halteromyces radiatus]KAI8098459.1 ras guanine nucleotide exchange factor domain-containing protein [Halteromyces radiatus]
MINPDQHTTLETVSLTLRTMIDTRLQSMNIKKQTSYLIHREMDVLLESVHHVQKLALHHHPAYQTQLITLTNHADRLVDALMAYDVGDIAWQLDGYQNMKRGNQEDFSFSSQFDTMGRRLKRTLSPFRNQSSYYNSSKDRRQFNAWHGFTNNDNSNSGRTNKSGLKNLFISKKSSRSSLRDLFNSQKKRDTPVMIGRNNGSETLLPDNLNDSFYKNSSQNDSHEKREIKGRHSTSAISSPPANMIQREKSSLFLPFATRTDSPPPPSTPSSFSPPLPPSSFPCQHYYDDPYFFSDTTTTEEQESVPTCTTACSKPATICSTDSSYFSAKSSSIHSVLDLAYSSDNSSTIQEQLHSDFEDDQLEALALMSLDNNDHVEDNKPPPSPIITTTATSKITTNKKNKAIQQLSGPPPLHQPGQPKKSREKDGSLLYHVFDASGRKIMVLQIFAGKPQVVAATKEQLFLKLADESPQDFDYVDAYLLNYKSFSTSKEFFDNIMARFHLEPSPGNEDYFDQWQRRIQIKTLNILFRWIKLQYSDFLQDESLLLQLEDFCDNDLHEANFVTESAMIKETLYTQACANRNSSFSDERGPHCSVHVPSGQNLAGSSMTNLFSNVGGTTPPGSPVILAYPSRYRQLQHTTISPFLSLDAKDIAKYLTLADHHIMKQIKPHQYLDKHWRDTQYDDLSFATLEARGDYIGISTKRTNMMNHWVIHELTSAKSSKQRRIILRKLIETSKLCLEWNNFHTSMVLTMGLLSQPVQKMEETWQSLPSRDQATFNTLEKLMDVSHNMAQYRQALKEGLHPGLFNNKRRNTAASNQTDTGGLSSSSSSSIKDHHLFTGSSPLSIASNTSLPTLLFFPMVLKDLTFLMDGNPTTYGQCHPSIDESDKNEDDEDKLINFAKFYRLAQYITKVVQSTSGNYWFAADYFPFLPRHNMAMDSIYNTTASTTAAGNCISCSSTRTSLSTSFSSSSIAGIPDHQTSFSLMSPSQSYYSTSSFFTHQPHQYYHHPINAQQYHCPSPPPPSSSSLDYAAEIIENRILSASSYYDEHSHVNSPLIS